MYIKDLMRYLDHFIDGDKGTAINNAKVYMKIGPYLEEVRRCLLYTSDAADE